MAERRPKSGSLPVLRGGTRRIIGTGGVVACAVCCLSIPGIAAALSAVGLGFLRNDRILFPGPVLCALLMAYSFYRAREQHHRIAPLVVGTLSAIVTLVGLRTAGQAGTVLVIAGGSVLLAVAVWDWRLQRRCAP